MEDNNIRRKKLKRRLSSDEPIKDHKKVAVSLGNYTSYSDTKNEYAPSSISRRIQFTKGELNKKTEVNSNLHCVNNQNSAIGKTKTKLSNTSLQDARRCPANHRLQLLRNKLNASAKKEWFSSDLVLPTTKVNSTAQNRSKNINSLPLGADGVKQNSNTKEAFYPLSLIGNSSHELLTDDEALTDYDDTAPDFGSAANDSPLEISSLNYNTSNGSFHISQHRFNRSIQDIDEEPSNLEQSTNQSVVNTSATDQLWNLSNKDQPNEKKLHCNQDIIKNSSISNEEPKAMKSGNSCKAYTTSTPHSVHDRLKNIRFSTKRSLSISDKEWNAKSTQPSDLTPVCSSKKINTYKPYSLDDRLINIKFSAKKQGNSTLPSTEWNVESLNLSEITSTCSSKKDNVDHNQSFSVMSNLTDQNNIENECQINNNRSILLKKPILDTKQFTGIRKSSSNGTGCSYSFPNNLLCKDTDSGNTTFNLFSSNNEQSQLETLLNWEKNSESSSQQSNSTFECDTDEPMDWCMTDKNGILENLQLLRKNVIEIEKIQHVPQTEFQEAVAKVSPEMPHNMTILREIYVVVDTNIFISQLQIAKKLLEIKINGVETPIIMIPWMVVQELDYIKDGRSGEKLKQKAKAAIRFINQKLTSRDPCVKGQSVMDAAKQDFSSTNPDDGILHCCLQIVEKRNQATLLSDDINLRNKALLHNIPAYDHNTILNALNPYQTKSNSVEIVSEEDGKIKDLKLYVSESCSYIISELLKENYGPLWSQHTQSNPPWPLDKCISLLKRYWIPIFSLHLNKQCAKTIDNFEDFLKSNKDGILNVADGERLIELSLALCVFLKNGLPIYKSTIDLCINNMQNVIL